MERKRGGLARVPSVCRAGVFAAVVLLGGGCDRRNIRYEASKIILCPADTIAVEPFEGVDDVWTAKGCGKTLVCKTDEDVESEFSCRPYEPEATKPAP